MNALENARVEIDRIDRQMAALFEERMRTVELVLEYKRANNMPILDSSREAAVIEKNSAFIEDEKYRTSYRAFIQAIMDISKQYQKSMI